MLVNEWVVTLTDQVASIFSTCSPEKHLLQKNNLTKIKQKLQIIRQLFRQLSVDSLITLLRDVTVTVNVIQTYQSPLSLQNQKYPSTIPYGLSWQNSQSVLIPICSTNPHASFVLKRSTAPITDLSAVRCVHQTVTLLGYTKTKKSNSLQEQRGNDTKPGKGLRLESTSTV